LARLRSSQLSYTRKKEMFWENPKTGNFAFTSCFKEFHLSRNF